MQSSLCSFHAHQLRATRGVSALVALLVFFGSHGCGGDQPPSVGPTGSSPSSAPSTTASTRPGRGSVAAVSLTKEEPYDSPELGGLHGTILFEGKAPERFELGAASSGDCKHHPGVDQRSNEIVVTNGKLAGVFVALDSGFDRAALPPVPTASVTLAQKGCMYVPRVLGMRAGQTLLVTNEDPTSHNVHTESKRNSPAINRTMGAQQAALELLFDKPELPIPFKCDIHPWMGAAVFVEEHPWFAVSDESGTFRIPDVPPGDYVVRATHEKLGKVLGRVTVKAGVSTGFTLTLAK